MSEGGDGPLSMVTSPHITLDAQCAPKHLSGGGGHLPVAYGILPNS